MLYSRREVERDGDGGRDISKKMKGSVLEEG